MSARLAARLFVDALRRRAELSGGEATILARGDETSGSVLLVHVTRNGREHAYERGPALTGPVTWAAVGPENGEPADIAAYVARRRRSDPDLWVVETAGPATMIAAVFEMTGGS